MDPSVFCHATMIVDKEERSVLVLRPGSWPLVEAQAPPQEKSGRKLGIPLLVAGVLWSGFANSMYYFTFEFQKSMKVMATQQFGVAPYGWGFLNMFPFFVGMFCVGMALMGARMVKERTVSNFWAAPGLGREYLLDLSMGLLWYLGQKGSPTLRLK